MVANIQSQGLIYTLNAFFFNDLVFFNENWTELLTKNLFHNTWLMLVKFAC